MQTNIQKSDKKLKEFWSPGTSSGAYFGELFPEVFSSMCTEPHLLLKWSLNMLYIVVQHRYYNNCSQCCNCWNCNAEESCGFQLFSFIQLLLWIRFVCHVELKCETVASRWKNANVGKILNINWNKVSSFSAPFSSRPRPLPSPEVLKKLKKS